MSRRGNEDRRRRSHCCTGYCADAVSVRENRHAAAQQCKGQARRDIRSSVEQTSHKHPFVVDSVEASATSLRTLVIRRRVCFFLEETEAIGEPRMSIAQSRREPEFRGELRAPGSGMPTPKFDTGRGDYQHHRCADANDR